MTPGPAREAGARRLFAVWALWVWLVWLCSGEMARTSGLLTMAAGFVRSPWPALGEAGRAAVRAVAGSGMVALAAIGCGRLGLIWLRRRPDALLAAAAGAPLMVLLTQGFGWLGLLRPEALVGAVLAVATAYTFIRPGDSVLPAWPAVHSIPWSVALPAGGAVIAVLLAACAPEVAWDAMVYHLRVPSLYLLAHKIYPIPEIFPSYFPFSGETLLLLARSVGGDPAARWLHALAWLGCGAAVARLSRRSADGGWATAVFLTVPLGMVIAGRAYVEFFMVLPLLGALIALAESPRRPAAGVCLLIGWLAGAACGTKYLGGFGAVLIAGMAWRHADWRPRPAALLALAALAAGGAWLVRTWLWTGNPVYPLAWGGPHWTAADMAGWRDDARALRWDPLGLLTAPWSMLAAPGGDGALSPLLLIAAVVPLCRPAGRRGPYWGLALALLVIWRITSPLPRYLAFALAVASVAGAGTFAGGDLGPAARRWARIVSLLGLWGSAACGLSAIAFGTNSYAPALGKVSRQAYRSSYFRPAGYPALLERLEARVPRTGRVYLLGHLFSYDLPRRVWFEFLYVRSPLGWWLADAPSAARLRVRARQAGLTHVAWLPIGSRAILGGHPEWLNWNSARLAMWREFWRTWMHETDRVAGWTVYEVASRPGRYPVPAAGTPGTDGAREANRVPAAGR